MPIRPKSRKKAGRSERRVYKTHEKVYGSYEWRRYSEQYRRDNPECAACGSTDKTHLDHIIPVSSGGSMWDTRNHQTLCAADHSRKTKREQHTPLAYRLNIDGEKIPTKSYKANRDDLTNDNDDRSRINAKHVGQPYRLYTEHSKAPNYRKSIALNAILDSSFLLNPLHLPFFGVYFFLTYLSPPSIHRY